MKVLEDSLVLSQTMIKTMLLNTDCDWIRRRHLTPLSSSNRIHLILTNFHWWQQSEIECHIWYGITDNKFKEVAQVNNRTIKANPMEIWSALILLVNKIGIQVSWLVNRC